MDCHSAMNPVGAATDTSARAGCALSRVGIDMDDVGRTLEDQGVASFHDSFAHVLAALDGKASRLSARRRGWAGWALFGLVAPPTAAIIAAQPAGLTHLDLPLLLGTIVTEDPDRARVAGLLIHLGIGQGFAFGYAATSPCSTGPPGGSDSAWARGTSPWPHRPGPTAGRRPSPHRVGRGRAGLHRHPRAALLGLNSGPQAPIVAVAAHLAYGLALGLLLIAR